VRSVGKSAVERYPATAMGMILFWTFMLLLTVFETRRRLKAAKLASTQRQYDKFIFWNILFAHPKYNGELITIFPHEKDNHKVTAIITGGMLLRFFYLVSIAFLIFEMVNIFKA
jgi:hypothetical protein